MATQSNPQKLAAGDGRPARRAAIGAKARAAIGGAPAPTSSEHPDAELLRLGAALDRLFPIIAPLRANEKKKYEDFEAEATRRGYVRHGAAWRILANEMQLDEVTDALTNVDMVIDGITGQIRSIEAKTFAGIAVKAKGLRWDCSLYGDMNLPKDMQDWQEQVMSDFCESMERLAADEMKKFHQ